MRVYGRQPLVPAGDGSVQSNTLLYGNYRWVAIETECDGSNSSVYITALVQCLRLNLQESPFYAKFGIPAEIIVLMQLQPDYYVSRIQKYFAQFFASLIITKEPQVPGNSNFGPGDESYLTPVYNVNIICKDGQPYSTKVAV